MGVRYVRSVKQTYHFATLSKVAANVWANWICKLLKYVDKVDYT